MNRNRGEMYEGRKFTLRYLTNGYYDIAKTNTGFRMEYKRFDKPAEKSFDDYFFNEWLEDPVAYGAFEDGQLLGYVEGTLEKWNNRYRISNICVFDDTRRHNGVGTALMNTILKEAKESGARMVVLETQTCNEKAIAFTARMGLILSALICMPTLILIRNAMRLELRWEKSYESKT